MIKLRFLPLLALPIFIAPSKILFAKEPVNKSALLFCQAAAAAQAKLKPKAKPCSTQKIRATGDLGVVVERAGQVSTHPYYARAKW